MTIQKNVSRQFVLSAEDLQQALWHYLKHGLDQPVPDDAERLTVTHDDGKVSVSWTEAGTVDAP